MSPFDVSLDAGQTYLLTAGSYIGFTSLTGTSLTSDRPISVFAGHPIAFVPVTYGTGDHIVEQLPPLETWGRRFETMPLATRLNGDTFRILAAEDNTTVHINGQQVATLDRGQVHEQIIEGPAQILADRPILVAQLANGNDFDGVTGDPMMMLVTPDEQFLAEYTISTPEFGFESHFVNVIATAEAVSSVTLDGIAVPASQFVPIDTSGLFGAQLAITPGNHHLESQLPIGAIRLRLR